jgi:hypothetical protein
VSSSVNHVVIWKLIYVEFSEVGETFCFQAKALDSIHIDVEQLLEGTQWKFVMVVVIGVINKLS